MISYELYKWLHFTAILSCFSALSASLWGNKSNSLPKILGGISSLLILVSGMGLLARIGVGHGGTFPIWVMFKIGLWLFITLFGPIAAKRLSPQLKSKAFLLILLAGLGAVYVAINHP